MGKREYRGGRKAWRVGVLGAIAACGGAGSQLYGSPSTWVGKSTGWSTSSNWSPTGIPDSSTASVIFTNTGVGTVNIGGTVTVLSILFTNTTGNYGVHSNDGQSLNGVTSITMASNVTGTDDINLTSASAASLQYPSGSDLNFINNSVAGGILTFGVDGLVGTTGTGSVNFQGPGTMFMTGYFSTNPSFLVTGGLTKSGPGLLDYNGHGASLTGSTSLNGGTLDLDFSMFAVPKAGTGASLVLGSGVLQLVPNSGGAVTQSYSGGTTVNAGHTDIKLSGTGAVTLNTFTITHNVGGTVDFVPTTGTTKFTITTTTGTTNGLLGSGPAYATVAGGTTWASATTVTGGSIVGLTTYGTDTYSTNTNTDVTASLTVNGFNTNSLRFNTGSPNLNITAAAGTLQSGGVLVTPNATSPTISGNSSLSAAASGELFFHIYNTAGLSVSVPLISTTGLTKTGPGPLTLSASNTGLTGPININRGTLKISTTAAVNSASRISFNDDRTSTTTGSGLQQFTIDLGNNTSGIVSTPITLSAFSATDYGTYFSTGNSTGSSINLTGVIGSAPGLTTPIAFTGTTDDSNTFDLSNPSNTFTGNILLKEGLLQIAADGSLGNSANILTLNGSTTTSGLGFLQSAVNVSHAIAIPIGGRITVNNADSAVISGAISGTGSLIKDGTGTLTLSSSANTLKNVFVNAGNLLFTSASYLPAASHLILNKDSISSRGTAVVINADSANIATYRNLLLSGYNTGNWSAATGISSTTASVANAQGIGYLTGANYLLLHPATAFLSNYTVQPTDILLKYTYLGDANLDGIISVADYAQLDAAFLLHTPSPTWFNGDFNYDGVIDYKDYALIDYSLAHQSPGPLADSEISLHASEFGTAYLTALSALSPTPIPEPTTLSLLAIASLALPVRRRPRPKTFPL